MWRRRQWRKLLNLIQRLPQNSHLVDALAQDRRYADQLIAAERAAERDGAEKPPPRIPFTTWTPEVAKMTEIHDALRSLQHVVATGIAKKRIGEFPKPLPRPTGVYESQKFRRRQQAHEELVGRVLPHKRPPGDSDTLAPE